MVVSWNSPPSEDQNGIIIYYLLLITQEQFNISDRVINTISNATSYNVDNLEEYNNYTCRVAAATRIDLDHTALPFILIRQKMVCASNYYAIENILFICLHFRLAPTVVKLLLVYHCVNYISSL